MFDCRYCRSLIDTSELYVRRHKRGDVEDVSGGVLSIGYGEQSGLNNGRRINGLVPQSIGDLGSAWIFDEWSAIIPHEAHHHRNVCSLAWFVDN